MAGGARQGATDVTVAALDRWIREFARLVGDNKDLLTPLDAAIGDADHGANMHRGMSAVDHADARPQGPASYLGERSIGHQDPGATSMALLIAAAGTTLPRAGALT